MVKKAMTLRNSYHFRKLDRLFVVKYILTPVTFYPFIVVLKSLHGPNEYGNTLVEQDVLKIVG